MLVNEYLYGPDAEIDEVPALVIVRRIETLKDLREELLEPHYMDRDQDRIRAIDKEIDKWEKIND